MAINWAAPFMGLAIFLLWPVSGSGLDKAGHRRDREIVSQTHQVGALFEALNERVLMAPSKLPCIFSPSKPSFTNDVSDDIQFAPGTNFKSEPLCGLYTGDEYEVPVCNAN